MASAKIIKGEFKWHGPDRRDKGDRRVQDRREEVRYEPAKDDRRDGTDRRDKQSDYENDTQTD